MEDAPGIYNGSRSIIMETNNADLVTSEFMMIDLDPSCLRAFLAVADEGGFTKAAHSLNRTQSAVSMQIRRLEELLGVKLIEDRKKATLTPAGERILEQARHIVALNDEILGRADGADIAGRVKIGTPDDYIAYFLPPVLRRLSVTHPLVEIEVRCGLSGDLIQAVDRGHIDFALVTRLPGLDGGVTVRREKLIWVAGDEAVTRKRPLPLAMFSNGCPFREAAFAALRKTDIPWRVAYESMSTGGLLAAALEGLALAVITPISLLPGLKILDARHGMPELPAIEIALYGPRGLVSPATQAVKASVMEALAADLGSGVAVAA
jgi:DNA-binding transcriptional LysR family regulator